MLKAVVLVFSQSDVGRNQRETNLLEDTFEKVGLPKRDSINHLVSAIVFYPIRLKQYPNKL